MAGSSASDPHIDHIDNKVLEIIHKEHPLLWQADNLKLGEENTLELEWSNYRNPTIGEIFKVGNLVFHFIMIFGSQRHSQVTFV
jgi:beta-lactamase superfamily II metal-dependent hydrolase